MSQLSKKIKKDVLLFHAVHGLCRVARVSPSSSRREASYTLLPVKTDHGKVRFEVPFSALEESGFSILITKNEGEAILDFFGTSGGGDEEGGHAWQHARLICEESLSRETAKDARKRQEIERAAKSLVSELAFVLKMTLPEVKRHMEAGLRRRSEIHPMVSGALAKAGDAG